MTSAPDFTQPLALLACLPESDAAALLERMDAPQIKKLADSIDGPLTVDHDWPDRLAAQLQADSGSADKLGEKLTGIESRDLLAESDPTVLAQLLEHELPQTVTELLKQLPPQRAAATLARLPTRLQLQVTQRIVGESDASPEMQLELCLAVAELAQASGTRPLTPKHGPIIVARLIDRMDQRTQRALTENLAQENPELLEHVIDLRRLLSALRNRRFVTAIEIKPAA